MRKMILMLLSILLVLSCAIGASAEETAAAKDISGETNFAVTGFSSDKFLWDKDVYVYAASKGNASVTLENEQGMGSLYLLFDYEYGKYLVKDNQTGESFTAGTNGFLHEYVDLVAEFGYAPVSVTLQFDSGAVHLSEMYIFSQGEVPGFVQKWHTPVEHGADILMLPAHGDDDQLYFAGLLPLYAGELDLRVQVAYLTNHRDYTNIRYHEILNGLWGTGVENYPVFATDMDFRVDSLEGSYKVYKNYKVTRDDLVGFVVEQLRRFRPQVAVGHDIFGEYGHGMHLVYADVLMAAVEISADSDFYPESAAQYGVWDVPKTYLHLLEENPVVINYDVPLERFDGLTAFQVTQKFGFPCHESQHVYTAFSDWLYGKDRTLTKASEIEKYSPCEFGLYRTTIGPDVEKNDFMENLISYDMQIVLAQQEQERLEQEKLEQEKAEQERLEQEKQEQARQEQERLEKEQAERERMEQLQKEVELQLKQARRRNLLSAFGLAAILLTGFNLGSKWANKKLNKGKNLRVRKK